MDFVAVGCDSLLQLGIFALDRLLLLLLVDDLAVFVDDAFVDERL